MKKWSQYQNARCGLYPPRLTPVILCLALMTIAGCENPPGTSADGLSTSGSGTSGGGSTTTTTTPPAGSTATPTSDGFEVSFAAPSAGTFNYYLHDQNAVYSANQCLVANQTFTADEAYDQFSVSTLAYTHTYQFTIGTVITYPSNVNSGVDTATTILTGLNTAISSAYTPTTMSYTSSVDTGVDTATTILTALKNGITSAYSSSAPISATVTDIAAVETLTVTAAATDVVINYSGIDSDLTHTLVTPASAGVAQVDTFTVNTVTTAHTYQFSVVNAPVTGVVANIAAVETLTLTAAQPDVTITYSGINSDLTHTLVTPASAGVAQVDTFTVGTVTTDHNYQFSFANTVSYTSSSSDTQQSILTNLKAAIPAHLPLTAAASGTGSSATLLLNGTALQQVTYSAIDSYLLHTTPNNIYCYLDAAQLDLYDNGITLQFNDPTGGMCSYTEVNFYDYYEYQPGTIDGTSTPTCTETIDQTTTPTSYSGSCPGGVNLSFNTTSDAFECTFDYTTLDPAGPNCCEGEYNVTTTTITSSGSTVTSAGPITYQGKVSNCLVGPAVSLQPPNANGFPMPVLFRNEGQGQNKPFSYEAPILNPKGPATSNIGVANYFNPSSFNTSGSETGTFPPVVSTDIPAAMKTVSGFTTTYEPNPYYEFKCEDAAGGIVARIRVLIRSWDTVTDFTADSNPYTNPLTLQPGFNLNFFVHDRDIWQDFCPISGTGCTDPLYGNVFPMTDGIY